MDLKSIGRALLDFVFPQKEREKHLDRLTVNSLTTATPIHSEALHDIEALLSYRDPNVQQLIKTLKYRGRRESANLLAEVLYAHLIEDLGDRELYENFTDPVLIPVPLFPARMRERGFNQVEWVLQEFRKFDDSFEIQKLTLTRVKNTPSQTKQKSRQERMHNLQNAFEVKRPELIQGRNIVLIDDVITTGSTLYEAQKTLLERGARKVICIALAH